MYINFFINFLKHSWRQIIYWGMALTAAIGAFLFARQFVACWQLTALPGVPPPPFHRKHE